MKNHILGFFSGVNEARNRAALFLGAMTANALLDAELRQHRATFSDVESVDYAGLLALQAAYGRVVLVDVRTDDEFRVSSLPGAVHLADLHHLQRRANEPLVTFCTVGFRSCLEARRLKLSAPAGTRVVSFSGVLEWAQEGGELVEPTTGSKTRRLHAYGPKWAKMAPEDFEVVVFDRCFSCSFLMSLARVPVVWLLGIAARRGSLAAGRTGAAPPPDDGHRKER